MNIEELIPPKEQVILSALKHPALKPARNPTIEQAIKQVFAEVKAQVVKKVEDDLTVSLANELAAQVFISGPYEDIANDFERNEWESVMDDRVEAAVGKWEALLSASWFGEKTVESGVWLENGVQKLARSAGNEVFKQLSHDKTPNKVLASAGIVQDDVEIYFDQHMNGQTEETTVETAQPTMETIVAKMAKYLGKGYDSFTVYADVMQVMTNDDEVLCSSSASRLGLSPEDAQVMAFEVFTHGDVNTATQAAIAALDEELSGEKEKAAAKAAKGKSAKADAGAPPYNSLPPSVFEAMKEFAGVKDTKMAEDLGISRSQYTKYVKGSLYLVPTAEQLDLIKETLGASNDAIAKALEACNSVQPE